MSLTEWKHSDFRAWNVYWARYCKLFKKPQESILSLAGGRYDNPIWRTCLPGFIRLAKSIPWNRFPGSLNVYKYFLCSLHIWSSCTIYYRLADTDPYSLGFHAAWHGSGSIFRILIRIRILFGSRCSNRTLEVKIKYFQAIFHLQDFYFFLLHSNGSSNFTIIKDYCIHIFCTVRDSKPRNPYPYCQPVLFTMIAKK